MSLTDRINALKLKVPSPIQLLESELLHKKKIRLYVKREDLIHPLLTGNKWRKLKYNLLEAERQNKRTLLSFGGAYSNHIHALAAAGDLLGFKTIGVIRGERPEKFSETLKFADSCGMQLKFIDRESYRKKNQPEYLNDLYSRYGDVYILPEGGSNQLALKGCAEIIAELDVQLDVNNYTIATAVGSGGTAAGLLTATRQQRVIGVAVLKGADFLNAEVRNFLRCEPENFTLLLDYHFGGYAKVNDELLSFIKMFKQQYGVTLEPVYTGKLFYALFDMIEKNYFPPGITLVALHTGGLQGLSGFEPLL